MISMITALNSLNRSENKGMMSPDEIRTAFIEFYKKKNHKEIASVPLLAENDPTLLFVNS